MKRTTVKLDGIRRAASIVGSSWNAETRTLDIEFASETPVRINSWDGPVMETLSLNSAHLKLDRLNSNGPLLNDHQKYGIERQLGSVIRAWVEGGKAKATVKLSKRCEGIGIIDDLNDGIYPNVSCGYRVYKYEKSTSPNGIPSMRAVDWEPYEVSFTSVPADYTVGVRSADTEGGDTIIEDISTTENNPEMKKPQFNAGAAAGAESGGAPPATPPAAAPPAGTPPAGGGTESPVDADQVRRLAIQEENQRVTDIDNMLRRMNITDMEFRSAVMKPGVSFADATRQALEKFTAADPARGTSAAGTHVGRDLEREATRSAMELGLVLRSGYANIVTDEAKTGAITREIMSNAERFRRFTMVDICRAALDADGVNTRSMGSEEIAKLALRNMITSSTSDLPIIFEGSARRVMLNQFSIEPDVWSRVCVIGSVGDFRDYKRVRPGSLSSLDKVGENGEYKTKKLQDAEQEKVNVETYGNIINITRKMIINDDLGALLTLAGDLGRASARSIEVLFFQLLAQNSGGGPTMADGQPLFHSTHGNIATTVGAISVDTLDKGRTQMALQMDVGKNDYINVSPNILLCPISMGSDARVTIGAEYNIDVTNKFQVPNKVRNMVRDVVDTPRLAGTAWYLFADPSQHPVIEATFLNGQREPFLEMQEAFTTDGVAWKVRHDFGMSAIGWRGALRNAGA